MNEALNGYDRPLEIENRFCYGVSKAMLVCICFVAGLEGGVAKCIGENLTK